MALTPIRSDNDSRLVSSRFRGLFLMTFPNPKPVNSPETPNTQHYSLPELADFVTNPTKEDAEAILQHLDHCSECADRVSSLRQTLSEVNLPAAKTQLLENVMTHRVRDVLHSIKTTTTSSDSFPLPSSFRDWDHITQWLADMFSSGLPADQILVRSGMDARKILTALCERRPTVSGSVKLPNEPKNLFDLLKSRTPKSRLLRHLTVFESLKPTAYKKEWSWAERIEHFGYSASRYVVSLLNQANTIGVGWGRMVAGVIDGIRSMFDEPPLRIRGPLRCVATVGGFVDEGPFQDPSSSSILTRRLCQTINGNFERAHLLAAVEAFIATFLDKEEFPDEVTMVRKRIKRFPNYQSIFGSTGRPGYIHQLDGIITSCGDAHHRSPLWNVALSRLNRTPEELNEITFGNLGGALIKRENLSPDGIEVLNDIESRWTGVTLEHFRQCVERTPGVILVALGHNKADVVLKCVEMGLVTQLLVDEDLAMTLWDKVDPDRTYKRTLELMPGADVYTTLERNESSSIPIERPMVDL